MFSNKLVQLVVVFIEEKRNGDEFLDTLVLLSVVQFLQGLFTSDTLDNIHEYQRWNKHTPSSWLAISYKLIFIYHSQARKTTKHPSKINPNPNSSLAVSPLTFMPMKSFYRHITINMSGVPPYVLSEKGVLKLFRTVLFTVSTHILWWC